MQKCTATDCHDKADENFKAPLTVSEALERAAARERGLLDWLVTRDGRRVIDVRLRKGCLYKFEVTVEPVATKPSDRWFTVDENGTCFRGQEDVCDVVLTTPDWYTEADHTPEPTTVSEALAAGRCDLVACDNAGRPLSIEANTGAKLLDGHVKPYLYRLQFFANGKKGHCTYTDCGKMNQNCKTSWDLYLTPKPEATSDPGPTPKQEDIDDMPTTGEIPGNKWNAENLITNNGVEVQACGFLSAVVEHRWVLPEGSRVPVICDRYGKTSEGWHVLLKPAEPYSQVIEARRRYGDASINWYLFEFTKGTPLPVSGKKYRITEVLES